MFCPLNSCIIKRSRASERSDQVIKDNFHRSKFLIPVTNASTGEVYATTSCSGPYFYVWPVRLHILEPDRVLVLIAAVEE